MVPQKTIFIFGLSLFFFGMLALSFQNKSFCINSQIVERLDIIEQKNYQTVFRCGAQESGDFQENLVPWIYSLQKILPEFESYFPQYGKFPQRVRIVVTKDLDATHWLSSEAIYISESLLQSKRPLLEDLTFILLRSRFPNFSDLTITFMSKLFYQTQFGGSIVCDEDHKRQPQSSLSLDQMSEFILNQNIFSPQGSLKKQFTLPDSLLVEQNHFNQWVVNRKRQFVDDKNLRSELLQFKNDLQQLMQKSDFFKVDPDQLESLFNFMEEYFQFQMSEAKSI